MQRRRVQTVRSPKVPTNRHTTAEQVFGFATVPRNFMGHGNHQTFLRSPNGILISYAPPPDLHPTAEENPRQINQTYGSTNNLSNLRNEIAASPMVVDGLVVNRFSRNGGGGKLSSGYGSFGNKPGVMETGSRFSEEGGEYVYTTKSQSRHAQPEHPATLRRPPSGHQESSWPPPPPPPIPPSDYRSSYSYIPNNGTSQKEVSQTRKFDTTLRSKKSTDKYKDKYYTLTKEETGNSVNFRHSQNEAWNCNREFDYNRADQSSHTQIENAGGFSNHLKKEHTRKFSHKSAVPFEASLHSAEYAQPILNPRMAKPLPPPPPRPVNVAYSSRNYEDFGSQAKHSSISRESYYNAGDSFGSVPPPPPPPPQGAPPPPPPPPTSRGIPDFSRKVGSNTGQGKNVPAGSDGRSELMSAIQKGVQLKKVDNQANRSRRGFRK